MTGTPFSNDYWPPAPVLPVIVCYPDGAPQHIASNALVDTGADGTMAPIALLEQLGIPVSHMVNVRSHLGEYIFRAAVHIVDLIIWDQIRLPGVEVVCDDWGDQIILGRNVLNKLRLNLDGPNQSTDAIE